MVKIKRINNLNEKLIKKIYDYFYKSKPYDFCQIKSPTLRAKLIKEYIDSLNECSHIYIATIDEKFIGLVFLNFKKDLQLYFAFGELLQGSNIIIKSLHLILKQACQDSGAIKIQTDLLRKFKRNILYKWLQKYDKKCKFINNDSLTQIEWYPHEWQD